MGWDETRYLLVSLLFSALEDKLPGEGASFIASTKTNQFQFQDSSLGFFFSFCGRFVILLDVFVTYVAC